MRILVVSEEALAIIGHRYDSVLEFSKLSTVWVLCFDLQETAVSSLVPNLDVGLTFNTSCIVASAKADAWNTWRSNVGSLSFRSITSILIDNG